MNDRADARATAAMRREQHRMAAAGLLFMLGMIRHASWSGMFWRTLVIRSVLFRLPGKWIAEMMRDRFLDLLALAHDPHYEEKGHHRRHEVGVSHFPGATTFASHGSSRRLGVWELRGNSLSRRYRPLSASLPALPATVALRCSAHGGPLPARSSAADCRQSPGPSWQSS